MSGCYMLAYWFKERAWSVQVLTTIELPRVPYTMYQAGHKVMAKFKGKKYPAYIIGRSDNKSSLESMGKDLGAAVGKYLDDPRKVLQKMKITRKKYPAGIVPEGEMSDSASSCEESSNDEPVISKEQAKSKFLKRKVPSARSATQTSAGSITEKIGSTSTPRKFPRSHESIIPGSPSLLRQRSPKSPTPPPKQSVKRPVKSISPPRRSPRRVTHGSPTIIPTTPRHGTGTPTTCRPPRSPTPRRSPRLPTPRRSPRSPTPPTCRSTRLPVPSGSARSPMPSRSTGSPLPSTTPTSPTILRSVQQEEKKQTPSARKGVKRAHTGTMKFN